MSWMLIAGGAIALALGFWIGLGAPGWPRRPEGRGSRLRQRPLNPVSWGRAASRERPSRRDDGGRRPRLR